MIEKRNGQAHRVNSEHFYTLAAGGGDQHAVAALWASERSWRLLALRDLVDMCTVTDGVTGPLAPVGLAWQLLTRSYEASPATTEEVLARPQVGIWAAHTLRRLVAAQAHLTVPGLPLWVDVGYLHALAAGSAARAGLSFEVDVPVRHGTAILPTVGAATVAPDLTHVSVRAENGRIIVDGTVRADDDDPRWHPPIHIGVSADGVALHVELLDRDIYRDLRRPGPPRPATADQTDRWRRILGQAWELLVREHRGRAEAMAAMLRTIAPVPRRERFRPLSASGGEAFGGLLLSEPDDPLQLAVTLVHEAQHQKLGALLHLFTLATDDHIVRCYAPWRDDPRPVGGLLQGVYAFAGITAFWRAHRRHAGDADGSALADFEFALWRRQTLRGLATLRGSDRLTDDGRSFVALLSDTIEEYQHDPVPAATLAVVRRMAADHHAMWRAANIPVEPSVGTTLATAWQRGEPPPVELLAERGTVREGPAVGDFDARAVLLRYRLADPAAFERIHAGTAGPVPVSGATPADVSLIAGDTGRASRRYRAALAADPTDHRAWIGLGLTLPAGADAARALLTRPELVVAAACAAPTPDPLDLAGWLGGNLPPAESPGRTAWRLARP